MLKELAFPTKQNSTMAHTAVLTTVKKTVDRISKTTGVPQNVIINTLLLEGLKTRSDLMACGKKKATKKVAKKTKK